VTPIDPNSGRAALPPIRFADLARALLDMADTLLPQWLAGGVKRGPEWVCGSLGGEAGSSCSINMVTGQWGEFSTGEQGGDLISLYGAIHGLSMGKAALQVARDHGLEDVAGVMRDAGHVVAERPAPAPAAAPKRPVVEEGWQTQRPVPATAPAPTFRHMHRATQDIEHTAEYRHGADLMGYVVRFRTSDGGKDTLPFTWCVSSASGTAKWHWKQFDEPRPLYLPGHRLPASRTVVVVEGEKKGDTLQALLDATAPGVYCVVSWPGGCKAWNKADWAPLAGLAVMLWPDADSKRVPLTPTERKATPDALAQQLLADAKPFLPANKQPGMAAMLAIGHLLADAHGCMVQLLPLPQPGTLVDGWDCGDAITTDGWDGARVLAFFGKAQMLPSAVVDAPVAAAGAAGSGDGKGPPKKIDPSVGTEGDDSGERRPAWIEPFWNSKKGYWMVSRELVIAALENDPNLVDLVAVNKLTNNIDLRGALPGSKIAAGPLTGAADLLLGRYLSQRYGLPSISRAALSEGIETVAHQHEFHPVRDYLVSLHDGQVWDGEARLDKWLVDVIDETAETLKPKEFEYLCLVGRLMLLGMVNRVMNPGCKFDYCPVLEGPGGLRKSTLVKVLAGKAWFSDTHMDLGRGKEGQEQVQGLWVYEIAELASFSKSDLNLIKAFVSAEVDRYRPSYGRVVEAYPRQCVLVGTTNEKHWLRDRTGNRRWWPILVRNRINTDWVEKYRDQLFSEAYAAFLEGAVFYPSPEQEERLFVPMQDKRLVESTVMSALLEVLTRPGAAAGIGAVVNDLTSFVTIKQLNEALHVDAGKSTASLDAQIRSWLDHEGWAYCKKQVNGVRAHGYSRPAIWPRELPEDEKDGASEGSPPQTGSAPSSHPQTPVGQYLEQEADDAPF
jgi:hypothetical protein